MIIEGNCSFFLSIPDTYRKDIVGCHLIIVSGAPGYPREAGIEHRESRTPGLISTSNTNRNILGHKR